MAIYRDIVIRFTAHVEVTEWDEPADPEAAVLARELAEWDVTDQALYATYRVSPHLLEHKTTLEAVAEVEAQSVAYEMHQPLADLVSHQFHVGMLV